MTRMAMMMLSREVRRVPMDYEPPAGPHGHQPVLDRFYDAALAEWQEKKRNWDEGGRPDYWSEEDRDLSYEEWDGEAPDPVYHYPGSAWPAGSEMGIRMYESVTEGTPISKAYPDTDAGRRAMAEELAQQNTGITSHFTAEDWLDVIQRQVVRTDIDPDPIVRQAGKGR